MPARDPAASPHLPNLSSSHGLPPTWLQQGRRGSAAPVFGIGAQSSSPSTSSEPNHAANGFSSSDPHRAGSGSTDGEERDQRDPRRRSSVGKPKRGMWQSLTGSVDVDRLTHGHEGDERSIGGKSGGMSDAESIDPHPAHSGSHSTDKEAIRDSSNRLAMSFTSDQSTSERPPFAPRSFDIPENEVGPSRPTSAPSDILKPTESEDIPMSDPNTPSWEKTTPRASPPNLKIGEGAPGSKPPSPRSAPSGLSVLLERQRRSQQDLKALMDGKGREKGKGKGKGKNGLEGGNALGGMGTDEIAPGANGLAGLMVGPSAIENKLDDRRSSVEKDGEGGEEAEMGSPISGSVSTEATPRPARPPRLESESSVSSSDRTATEDVGATQPKLDVMPRIDESPSRASFDERTPLLAKSTATAQPPTSRPSSYLAERKPSASPSPEMSKPKNVLQRARTDILSNWRAVRKATWRDVVREAVVEPVKTVPATILGTLLNVLDGVSYGMIMFPASPVFAGFGSIGVSMFFVSCIIAQLTYTLGGSIFRGGNGSMMIEAVPFFHILTNKITDELGEANATAIIATTMVSYAFSAILTGLVFMLLGTLKLGGLIGYFPRHILVGCIGGVGVFLLVTGLEVARGLKEEGFEWTIATLKIFFENGHAIALWTIPLALAIVLRMITHRYTHQLIFPGYFFVIPCVFYIVVAISPWNLDDMRKSGWIFDVGEESQPWYTFYEYFDFKQTSWSAFWACMPTQLALVFFGILHVPLNVPALGVSLQEDNVDLDRELVAHGVSNMAAGFFGTVPNYLCYVNTVLFYRVGGGSRLSGLMLVGATAIVMFIGPSVIGFLPVMVVGALIFVLGIDLVKEAVWDTRHRVNKMEYATIWAITIGMTIFDFVIGLLIGIIMASMFFVVQNSRRKPIRAILKGTNAKSTVRRPQAQRAFIQAVGKQTVILKLQGFLFFGTITKVEDEIRRLLDIAAWEHNPIRFLICDFSLVPGLDFSSAEAFVRVQRLLSQKDVLLILCGADPEGLVGKALQAVDLWADMEGTRVEVFLGLNDALEWCENAYLTAFYASSTAKKDSAPRAVIDFPTVQQPPFAMSESFQNSPRRRHLEEAGVDTLPSAESPAKRDRSPISPATASNRDKSPLSFKQPLPVLLQTFSAYTELRHDFFHQLVSYFTLEEARQGTILFRQDDTPSAMYLIESGCLRATYQYTDHTDMLQETMVAGTVAGELSMLSGAKRNATVAVERDARLWKLDNEAMSRLEKENPEVARKFVKVVLKVATTEWDDLSSHLIAVLS